MGFVRFEYQRISDGLALLLRAHDPLKYQRIDVYLIGPWKILVWF